MFKKLMNDPRIKSVSNQILSNKVVNEIMKNKYFQRLMIDFPQQGLAYLKAFDQSIYLKITNQNDFHSLQLQQNINEFQKVGGFVLVALLPGVGSFVGMIGLFGFPRNILNHHFFNQQEELQNMKVELEMMKSISYKYDNTSNSNNNNHNSISHLNNNNLTLLLSSNNITIFGINTLSSLIPSSQKIRWLELKLHYTALSDKALSILIDSKIKTSSNNNIKQKRISYLKDHIDHRLLRRLALQRGIDPLLSINEISSQLIYWIYSPISINISSQLPPITPSKLDQLLNTYTESYIQILSDTLENPHVVRESSLTRVVCYFLSPILNAPKIVNKYKSFQRNNKEFKRKEIHKFGLEYLYAITSNVRRLS